MSKEQFDAIISLRQYVKNIFFLFYSVAKSAYAVSYTHLDVYKRQVLMTAQGNTGVFILFPPDHLSLIHI